MSKHESERIDWLKNVLAFVTIVLLALLYFYLKGLNNHEPYIELILSIIPEFIAALVAILVVYYVFLRKGISSNRTLTGNIVQSIKESLDGNSFGTEEEIDNKLNLKEKIMDSKELQVLGYSCRYLFMWMEAEIVEAIKNGMDLRIITIEPGSKAADLMMEVSHQKALEEDLKHLDRNLDKINQQIGKNTKKSGSIQVCRMNWIPSCSLINLIPKRNKIGLVKLKIHSISHSTPKAGIQTHKIIYQNSTPGLFEYFLGQFNLMWEANIERNLTKLR